MILYLVALLSCFNLYSKPFANNFVEMNVPDDWSCAVYAGDQWTCQSMDLTKVKEALVVMSFSNMGSQDSLKVYYDYLNASLTMTDPSTGKKGKSVPKTIQYKDISGQTWVDSQHLSYAVPNYYTRFLATAKDGRSVLISLTVDKAKYAMYMSKLYKMVESIKLRATSPAEPMSTGLAGLFGTKLQDKKEKKLVTSAPVAPDNKTKWSLIISVLVGVVVFVLLYYYFRKRSKKKKKGSFFK